MGTPPPLDIRELRRRLDDLSELLDEQRLTCPASPARGDGTVLEQVRGLPHSSLALPFLIYGEKSPSIHGFETGHHDSLGFVYTFASIQ